jgi:hypothetical protein
MVYLGFDRTDHLLPSHRIGLLLHTRSRFGIRGEDHDSEARQDQRAAAGQEAGLGAGQELGTRPVASRCAIMRGIAVIVSLLIAGCSSLRDQNALG